MMTNQPTTQCKICGSSMTVHDHADILEKYRVAYYLCRHCGFIQTENPYWLEESYSRAIATSDTGIISRNLQNATDLLFILKFMKNDDCLDFGGGHGILTRIMRDYGFNFAHYDKYAKNLFANGFEGDSTRKYDFVTAFENFEHFVNPMEEIEKIIGITDVLYFSTLLIPGNIPLVRDWWYFGPSTGQHISFYSKKSLEYISAKNLICIY
jgi:2-polyprenyl-3-methyl-5-hydroxy-6-metoxy-1,4-benzoquinol methylase